MNVFFLRTEGFFFIFQVHPKTPEKLTVSGNSSTSIRLHWFINGSFAEIRLLCQIEISSGHSEQKLVSVTFDGFLFFFGSNVGLFH